MILYNFMKERVSKFAWTPSAKVSVVVSSLGDYAALYGLEYCLRKKIKDEVFC
jgi:glucokinase